MKRDELTVIDFFCGAGGFSEGFRQQGFKIVMGLDYWKPAVETHNLNHHLNDKPWDILVFEGQDDGDLFEASLERINALPNTNIIVGSPPCVSFSMANKAGKADKGLGIRLIESFLRVIAVKKWQPNSVLDAWYMENVPNSKNFVNQTYSFADLRLSAWSESIGKDSRDIALVVQSNGEVMRAADYGSPQTRDRFICGEIIKTGVFPHVVKTHAPIPKEDGFGLKLFDPEHPEGLTNYVTLGDIKGQMPDPSLEKGSRKKFIDPNYPSLSVTMKELTDHFYDSGVYEIEWERAEQAKTNHPYMGRMSFPEDEDRPSRTIMATRSASTREALLYRSGYNRKGDGEFRLPTIREAAALMGFPYLYQFTGNESTKWRQIGNAVCPHLSAAIAKATLVALGKKPVPADKISFESLRGLESHVTNLNTFEKKTFDKAPSRTETSRFRRQPFKLGNMTVALMNYDVNELTADAGQQWYTTVFVGAGKVYETVQLSPADMPKLEKAIQECVEGGTDFLKKFKKAFEKKIGSEKQLQQMYSTNKKIKSLLEPTNLVREIAQFIEGIELPQKHVYLNGHSVIPKKQLPTKQLLAMYSINFVTTAAKGRG